MKPLPPSLLIALLLFRLSIASSFLPRNTNTYIIMNQSPRSVVAVESLENNAVIGHSPTKMTSTKSHTNDNTSSMEHPRALVFEIAALVGELSTLFLTRVPLDPPLEPLPDADDKDDETNDGTTNNSEEFVISKPTTVAIEDKDVGNTMGKVLLKLLELSHALDLKLVSLIRTKMALNNKKYPSALCRGKSGKYTKYSAVTGITKDAGQSTLDASADNDDNADNNNETETVQDFLASLELLTADIGEFATARMWFRFHTPKNLLLALLGELGEVRAVKTVPIILLLSFLVLTL